LEIIEGKKCFNASSPDEIAMVEYFEEIGFSFTERDENYIKFYDPIKKFHEYKIIKLFPFESAKKRMGIIVKKLNSDIDEYVFYLKGADDVMREKVNSIDDKVFIEE
jgi:phospholipid-translocating ATPase